MGAKKINKNEKSTKPKPVIVDLKPEFSEDGLIFRAADGSGFRISRSDAIFMLSNDVRVHFESLAKTEDFGILDRNLEIWTQVNFLLHTRQWPIAKVAEELG